MSPHNSLLDISHNHSQRISRVLTVHFHAYSTYAYYITAQFGYWRSVHGHLHMKGLDLVWMCHSEVLMALFYPARFKVYSPTDYEKLIVLVFFVFVCGQKFGANSW